MRVYRFIIFSPYFLQHCMQDAFMLGQVLGQRILCFSANNSVDEYCRRYRMEDVSWNHCGNFF